MEPDRIDFMTTQWTLVRGAAGSSIDRRQLALEQLCSRYWKPLYAFLRRKGHSEHDSQDLVQGFFEQLLSKEFLKSVGQEKGRFRSFMLASIKHYAANARARAKAEKRGGSATIGSIDFATAEEWYRIEPADNVTPDMLFAEDPLLSDSFREPARQYRRYQAAVAMVAGDKREILKDHRMQSLPAILSIHPLMREQLNHAAASSTPSPAELAAAKELLEGEIAEFASHLTSKTTWICQSMFLAISTWWMYVAIPAAIAGLLFRGGLILLGFQMAVVRMNGRRAGRLRVFIRSCMAIVPAWVALMYVATVAYPIASVEPKPLFASIAVMALLVLIFVSNFFGPRSIPDRILGTAVVAK